MTRFFWYVLIQLTGTIVYLPSVTAQSATPQSVTTSPTTAAAQPGPQYIPSDQGSSVTFKCRNLGFNVSGSLTGLQGKIGFDPKDPSGAHFEVSVDAHTINTDNSMRDDHLKKEDYFDVQNHPRIQFVSTGIRPSGGSGHYIITGKLTIKSTTREISFPFLAAPMGNDYIFSGEFKIDRKDFGIGGSSTISNSIAISLAVFARK